MSEPLNPGNSDEPVAGHYKARMVKNGPWIAIRIWFGVPFDPETREDLDRSHRWRAERLGVQIDVYEVWPYCARWPIDEGEYRYLEALRKYAGEHDHWAPEADPRRAINLMKTPIPF